jgi:hypothetical protein
MNADLEKEMLGLKVNSNALNGRADVLLLACQLVAEYRQLNAKLLAHAAKLKEVVDGKIVNENGGAVPSPARQEAQ